MLGFCTAALLKNAAKLRWFQHYGSGVNHCMYPGIDKKDFILTNNQHSSAPPIAEHVIAMMMMLTRGLAEFHSNQAHGLWQGRDSIRFPVIEVSGKTMLVAGLGGIGTEVARRANALGMHVVATRHSSREGPDFVDYVGLVAFVVLLHNGLALNVATIVALVHAADGHPDGARRAAALLRRHRAG